MIKARSGNSGSGLSRARYLDPRIVTEHIRTALAAVRSLMAYVSVALYVLLLAPPGIVLTVVFKWPELLYWLARGGVRLGLATVGITCRVTGLEHIQHHRAAVYCVNHASNIEPPILFLVLKALHPKLVVLYKAELRKALPVLKRAWDVVGFVPIERGSRERSMQAIESAAAALRGGKSFLVFPEGTRSLTGTLLSFKKGGFIMAIKGGATIVPVAIQGTSAAMRKGSLIMRPVVVSVRLGPPIEVGGRTLDERDMLISITRAAVRGLLEAGPIDLDAAALR
jgi:1-acyl-sn-glycerol-3-phosphate acyltransferase